MPFPNRMVLVIGDEPAFARILYELAHDRGYSCLVALTGEDGFALATRTGMKMGKPLPENTEIEIKLLLEAIFLKYSYNFREYSGASARRRVLHALG